MTRRAMARLVYNVMTLSSARGCSSMICLTNRARC